MSFLEADKGYDSNQFRQDVLELGYIPVIAYRKIRLERVGTKEIADFFRIKRRRWVVERAFAWIKRKCRRLMMRWERLSEIWESFAKLGVIFMWLEVLLG